MKKGKFVTIKVKPATAIIRGRCNNWQYNTVPQVIETHYNRILNDTVTIMKQEAPHRTGQLKSSISIKMRTTSGGKRDKRYHGRVGPSVRYAQFVERGTGPSPGAFIAALEKRVRVGQHPGTPRNPFIQRTMDKAEAQASAHAREIGAQAKARFKLI